ncbi:MAG: DUF3383 domain-containing protein [Thiobacillus sp.]
MSVSANEFVLINPGVIGGGGNPLALNGVYLTNNAAVPIGTVQSFATAASVGAFFGLSSPEYTLSQDYFNGFANKTQTPGTLFFSQYSDVAVAGYLRGGATGAMTLAQLQAITGVLDITVAGTLFTSTAIVLTTATSFSNAATIIQAAFTSPTFTVTYDSIRGAFLITTTTTGATETISFGSGTISAGLLLTQATGALTSQGAAGMTPASAMAQILTQTMNWAAFSTVFNAVTADKLGFAAWANSMNNRYAYVAWDSNAAAIATPDTTSALGQIVAAGYANTVPVYCDPILDPLGRAAAFVMGSMASINFSAKNGRITFAFKYYPGIPVSVTSDQIYQNLKTNGYNAIIQMATANQGFSFFAPGAVTGAYLFFDELVNEIYLNAQLQLALVELMTSVPAIPYNAVGAGMQRAACLDPITQMLNFGGIETGVSLSALQASEVNNAAGLKIDQALTNQGYYLQILPPTAQVRAARGSFVFNLFYMDGGSVQTINMASVVIQ